jgi:hypothetical protein
MADRQSLETFLQMSSGYVLNFSDSTFGEFVFEKSGINIHSSRYTNEGTSKSKKLRAFWRLETDNTVGKLLLALIDYVVALDPEPPLENTSSSREQPPFAPAEDRATLGSDPSAAWSLQTAGRACLHIGPPG